MYVYLQTNDGSLAGRPELSRTIGEGGIPVERPALLAFDVLAELSGLSGLVCESRNPRLPAPFF
jgi:hypothetical protein